MSRVCADMGAAPMTDPLCTDERLADWVVEICLIFGADVVTAHKVAALFIEGLRARKLEKDNASV